MEWISTEHAYLPLLLSQAPKIPITDAGCAAVRLPMTDAHEPSAGEESIRAVAAIASSIGADR